MVKACQAIPGFTPVANAMSGIDDGLGRSARPARQLAGSLLLVDVDLAQHVRVDVVDEAAHEVAVQQER